MPVQNHKSTAVHYIRKSCSIFRQILDFQFERDNEKKNKIKIMTCSVTRNSLTRFVEVDMATSCLRKTIRQCDSFNKVA